MEQIKEKALHEAATSEQGTNEITHKDINIPELIMQVLEPATEILDLCRDNYRYFTFSVSPAYLTIYEHQSLMRGHDKCWAKEANGLIKWVDCKVNPDVWPEEEVVEDLTNAATTMQDLLGRIRKELEDGKK